MPELTKEIKRLYFNENLSYRQVAKHLGLVDSTVAKRLKKLSGGRTVQEATALRSSSEYSENIHQAKLGEKNTQAKLTEPDVLDIRSEYEIALKVGAQKTATQVALAKVFGVKRPTISDIMLRKTWKHI